MAKGKNLGLLFCLDRLNKNSVAALLAALGSQLLLDKVKVEFSSPAKILADYQSSGSKAAQRIICLSYLTWQTEYYAKIIYRLQAIKEAGDLIIAGGAHPSACPAEVLQSGADIVFIGEGEHSFPQFIKRIKEDGNYWSVPGIAFIQNGRMTINARPPETLLDATSTVIPQYNLTSPLEITRGCFYACKYCYTPRMFGQQVRHRSIESAVQQARHYPRYINFVSPNAFSYGAEKKGAIDKHAIIQLLSRIKATYPHLRLNFGIFPSEVRPDYVDREVIQEIKPFLANKYITLGVQSASNRVLQAIGRAHGVRQVLQAIDILRAAGFNILLDFIFALPGEDQQAEAENIKFLEQTLCGQIKLRAHIFTPLPGTPFAGYNTRLGTGTREFLQHCLNQNLIKASGHVLQQIAG